MTQRLVRILNGISQAIPDLKIVLSSSWRLLPDIREHVSRVLSYHDVTPDFGYEIDAVRGHEIQAWLELNPSVTRYAIVDDEDQLLRHQRLHFFRTRMNVGITQSIADKIVAHLTRE